MRYRQHLISFTMKLRDDVWAYPVSLFKIVMIQYIFRIRNMHQSIKAIESNYAQLWSISYDIGEDIPHFSTLEKHYCRLFKDTDYLHEF